VEPPAWLLPEFLPCLVLFSLPYRRIVLLFISQIFFHRIHSTVSSNLACTVFWCVVVVGH
jgi:hypothetical protein